METKDLKGFSIGLEDEPELVDNQEPEASEQDKNSFVEDSDSLEFEDIYSFVCPTNTPTLIEVPENEGSSDSPFCVIGQKIYNEFQWSDSDQSEIDLELPQKCLGENRKSFSDKVQNNNKMKYIKIKSGNLVKKIRLNFTDISAYFNKVKRLENYKKFLKMIQHMVDIKETTSKEQYPVEILDEAEILALNRESTPQQPSQRELWQEELAKIEEEIQTLKHVLQSKQRDSQELKKKLGISVWKELTDDLSQGVRNVKESNVYQKTESVMKATAESTRSIIGGLTGGFTQKIGQLKNSESFRSLEEKVGSAYENVKTKVSSSRSSSVQSFNEALREETANKSENAETPKSPTVAESKPYSF